jgi:hypothetical protein
MAVFSPCSRLVAKRGHVEVYRRESIMIRSTAFILALLVAGPTVNHLGQGATPAPPPSVPVVIGADRPVFLGSMTVEATALPQAAANH